MTNKLLIIVLTLLAVSCGKRKNQFEINGAVENGQDSMLYLDKLTANGIQLIDSAHLNGSGKFHFKELAVLEPEFFFLRFKDGKSLPLLVDSNEVITITTSIAEFPDAEIVGSDQSVLLEKLNRQMIDVRAKVNVLFSSYKNLKDEEERAVILDNISMLVASEKDSLGKVILSNPNSFISYYILYQKITDGTLLYNPYNEDDFKYFAAVATSLKTFHPDAPRTKAIYKMVEDVLKQRRLAKMQKMINEAERTLPEIALPNIKGDTLRLSDQQGKVVILNFWSLKSQSSPMLNAHFKQLYNSYQKNGLEIYQVSLDKSKILWEMAIEQGGFNWISVSDFNGDNLRAARTYNVQELPTTFIINRKGEVVKRVTDYRKIEEDIKAQL